MNERRFALIITNSEYQDPDLRKLLAPALDAEAFAKVLSDPGVGEFEVKALINKRSSEVNEETDMFFADRAREDLLLPCFSREIGNVIPTFSVLSNLLVPTIQVQRSPYL